MTAIAPVGLALPGANRLSRPGIVLARAAGVACLLALAILASPRADAQTEIWSATLTPQATDVGVLGCDSNDSDTADQCSNTAVLSDNNFTLDSTDYTIVNLILQGDLINFSHTPALTDVDNLVLVLGTTSLALSDATSLQSGGLLLWPGTGITWTAGTDVSVRLISLTAPGAPTGLAATANGPSRIDLAWTAPASTGGSAITGYKIEVSPDGTNWTDLVANTDSTATTYAHTGLNAATTRHYSVSAINAVGTSDASGSDDATTEASTVTAQTEVPVDWALKPADIGAGEQFRLMFVTSTTRNATSTDIAVYNTFVSTRAAAGVTAMQTYAADFTALVSTETVNARANTLTRATDTDAPIYWVRTGTVGANNRTANDYADFYDGTWSTGTTGYTESGSSVNLPSDVFWTGTNTNGTTSATEFMGGSGAVLAWGVVGRNTVTLARSAASATERIVALSPVFQVAATTSSDATLSALAIADASDDSAIAISPVFASGTTSYTASVDNDVDEITIAPTVNESNATVEYLDSSDAAIADADGVKTGRQVSLTEGANTIKVKVTAQDATTDTYTVVVTRAAAPMQTVVTFISNSAQRSSDFSRAANATAFTTGGNSGGYELSSVDIYLPLGGAAGETPKVEIFEDSAGDPGTLHATLNNPSSFHDFANTFNAPRNTTLRASTTYWLVSSNSAETTGQGFPVLTGNATADTGSTAGWSIGNARSKSDIRSTLWNSTSARIIFAVKGTAAGGTATNTAAVGAPTITGTARVGQTLTAVTTGITDADGLTSSTYTYQWIRVDGTDADIAGANSSTYTLDDADLDKTIRVEVSFTDDQGNSETLISRVYPTSGTVQSSNALVSNVGQTTTNAFSLQLSDLAQSFMTGANATGYTLASIELKLDSSDSTATPAVKLYSGSANGTAEATTFTGPPMLDAASSKNYAFTPTSTVTLLGSTTYWVVAEGDVRWLVGGAGEDATPATGWSIANNYEFRNANTTGSFTTDPAAEVLQIRVNGTLGGIVLSSDATLSALALEDAADDSAITISPVFVSGTTSYTASVDNDVDEITVEPTVHESNATVEYLDSTDTAIADANSGKTGQQVSLDVGANTIKVKVTAQDATTDTYTVVVTRALAMQTVVTFISNSAQLDANSSSIFIRATAFTTGGNSAGYELSSVDIYVPYFVSSSTIPRVEIYEDSGSDPGTLHATLNNPSSYQPSANTFNAPRNTTLRAGTTYWLVTSNRAAANGQNFLVSTGSATADTGSAAGWSIGNARSKTIITDTLWTLTTDRIIFAVKGTATGGTATNTAAAGAPTITGTAQVGETLTAVTTGIMDADGLTSPTYTYQWIRVDGTEADIAGANSSTYTLDDADLDKTIRVRVSFDDDEGNSETLISRVYPTSGTVQANNALVSNLGQSRTNAFRLALSDLAQAFTTGANPAGYTLSSIDLKLDSSDSANTPTVKLYSGSANGMEEAAFTGPAMLDASTVKNYAFAPSSTVILLGSTTYWVVAEGAVRWVLGGTGEDATPAMGWSIANNYEYRVATLSTGGFTTDSAGEVLQIRVNGTTGGVVTNTAPTAANNTVTTAEDRPYTFAADDFGFMDADAGAALASVKIVTPPALGTLALDGTAVTANDVVVWDDIEDDKLTFTPARDAHGAPYTTFTFKVNDGTDDSADAYTMTIDVTDALAPVCAAPSFGGRREIWSGTVTVEQGENVGLAYYGFDEVLSNGTLLPSQSFFTGSNNYVIDALLVRVNGALEISFAGNVILTLGELNALRMHVCDGDYDFITSSESQNTTIWLTTLDWSPPVVTRTVYLSLPGNNAATGEPAISGTATAGQVLTATTGTIADADGLPSSFTYQWLRVDADGTSNEEDISGEIAATYTLTDDDVGMRIKVKVSFTDDLSGEETRTSAAYPSSGTVTAASTTNTAPTAANKTVTTGEDRAYAFTADDFEFDDDDAGDTLASVKIVTPPAAGTLALDGTAVLADGVVTKAQIDGDMLTFTPARDAHGVAYTTFTFKVNDGTVDSASAYTMTIDVTDAPAPVCAVPNFAGEGRRQIWTGTVTVAQIYIPFTTIINGYGFEFPTSDTLGSSVLPSRAFSIGSHNYTITAIAVGISGKVVFTTDSNDIALTTAEADVLRLHLCDESFDFMAIAVQDETSYRWDASLDWSHPVVTRTVYLSLPTNHAATGEPAITGTAQVGQELTADASPIMDDNGLPSIFTYQWLRVDADGTSNEEDITGETDATYTLTDDDLGKKVKVKVSFVDILGSNEQRTSAPTATVIGLNSAPVFSQTTQARSIAENTAAGQNVGAAVTATDADAGDNLTYMLGGADMASFDFVGTTGQIRTKSGVTYDHEAKASYTVTVTASDGTATAVASVTISVTDVDEPPSAPATPMVSAVSGSTTRLSVSWAAPANAGKPAIDNYDVQYREGTSGAWTDGQQDVATTSTTITSLTANTLYQARVRATNAEGDSGWSEPPGSGRTNTPSNNAPVFDPAMPEREIAENTAAGQNVGAAVTATDADAGDTLGYTLGGADVASFDFVETTGQIRTKAGVSYDHEAKSSYTVTVTASDGTATADASVTIRVTDVDEPPSAPATPMVSAVSGSTTRLSVSWAAPANAGKPAIANYDVQYRVGSSGTWTDGPEDVATTTATITSLVANTLYEARVRATNAEGDSGWSDPPGSGRTNAPDNNAPVFDPAMPEREIAENTAAGQNVGAAVTATDADAGDNLTYMLGGADMASFDFVGTTGQIRTKSGVSYDFEAKSSYTVTVTATDNSNATAVATVTISVTDVDEPPSAPATPMVSAVSGSTTRLSVSWAAPANAGKPAIANYDVQYRVGSSGAWTDGPQDVTGTTATIASLVADTLYEARVRASNAEGDSGWSDPPGSGRTNAATNNAPVFSPAMPEREIAENTAAGVNVGAPVTATDADAGDTLSYTLGGADVASFDFVETTGQIRTKAGVSYDHEAKSSYTVTVTASDGTATADASVTIRVTDVDEPPSAPATPMVSAVSGSTTRLSVSWAAPANAGKPAIANYDVQYRVGSSGTWSDGPEDVAGTSTTIASLVANTNYEARVRATNAEGDSGWSDPPGSGRTNAPSNNAPVFDPAMPEREIAENTAAGQNVGAAVTATDADAGDNLTYMLGGADMASFDFVETTGQIRTKSGVSYDHEAKSSYTVTVTASDGTATADASVTIRVTDVDEPPNAPATPTVSAVSGSTTSLSVSWAAPANAGKPAIDNYDVQYRLGSSGAWTDGPQDVTGTTTIITGLATDTAYQARVRATNAEGDSGWSAPPGSGRTNAPSTSVPGAPGNLRTAPGDGRVTLAWTAPGNDGGAAIEKYRYRVRADGGSRWDPDWTDVPDGPDTGDSAADETTFTVSGLSNGTEYVFQLRAVNSVGEGPAASAADTPVRAPLPPGSGFLVGNFGQPADYAAQIYVTHDIVGVFTTGARGAELHDIEFRLFTRRPNINVLPIPSVTLYRASVTDSRATRGARVAALTAVAGSPQPANTAQTVAFAAPSGTRLDAGATYLVVLEHTSYVRVESTTYPAEDAGGAPGWAIDGIGAGNNSPYSYQTTASLLMRVNGTAAGAPVATAPDAPASLGAAARDARVRLIWTPPRSDGGAGIEKYQVRYSAGSRVDPDAAWTDVPDGSDSGTSRADERSVSVTELDNARQYAFELRAVNGVRAGAAATATATPAAARRTGFLVSNFGQPVDGAAQISVTQDIVGAFTAGALGATLDSIELRLYSRTPDIAQRPSATLYRGSVTGTRATPGTQVATLTAAPGSPRPAASAQTIVFTAPGGARLEAGATYLVVLAGSGYVRVEDTNSSAQDAGGASGWTIDGVGAGNSSPYSYGTSDSLLMSVNGTTARAQREEAAKDEQQEEEQEEEPATSPDPDRGISLSTSSSSAIEGQAATISVRRAGPTDRTTSVAVQVFDSALTGAWPIDLDFRSGVATVTATVAIPFDGARPASRTVTVRLASVEEPYSVGSPSTLTFNVTDRDAALSVDDASVSEGPGATLAFAVTLDRTRDREVRVKYATSDGTATQGEDYTGVSGTLRFAAGETTKTVSVPVLDDAHNEGSETLTLTLSSPRHAVIDDDTAVGTIVNSDPLPDAWLSRFGRAASDQVVQSIGRRLEGGARESHLTVMGWRVDALFDSRRAGRVRGEEPEHEAALDSPRFGRAGAELRAGGTPGAPGGFMAQGAPGAGALQMTEGAPDALRGAPAAVHAPGARGRGGPWAEMLQGLLMKVGAGGDVRAPALRDMVMGSSFYYGYSPDAGPLRSMNRLTAWGESASTRFSGAEGKLSLDGEVNTAILGADGEWGRWLAGLALSYSEGEGGYRQASAKGGAVSSTLSGVNPYARYRLDERTSFWATLGYGSGRLTLTPDGAESSLETDMTNAMAAFGGRGVLSMRAGETGQFELALRSDAMLTDTASMAVPGLSAGEGATSRIRLILEGTGSLPAFGGVLAPKVEAGLRYDGGDAETGAGLEVGGGLAYDKDRLTVQVDGRVLLTHRDRDYEEWGYSLSFVYQPGEDGRGLRYQAGSQWGATQSGVQSLWSLQNAGGLASAERTAGGQRYTAELGYGFGERQLWYPYVATESGGASSQALRFGLKLNAASDLEAGLEIGRRAHLSGQIENDIWLQWRARW